MSGGAGDLSMQLRRLLLRLETGEDVLSSLEMLNTLLASNQCPGQVSSQLISLPLLFSFLQTEDSAQVQLTCGVLEKLLCCLPGSELLRHAPYVELGLQYPVARLAKTCLQALLHHSCEEDVVQMIVAPTMTHLIAQALAGDHLECATLSSKIFLQVFSSPSVLMKSQEVLFEELRVQLSLGSVVRLRVYDWCVQLCLQGQSECCQIVSKAGLLASLVGELETEDILLKMNVLELLSSLIESQGGLAYIQSCHVLEKLHSMLQAAREDAIGVVLVPALLKFFGLLCLSVGCEAAELSSKFPVFLNLTLEVALVPDDPTLWGLAVDTFGLLAAYLAGRKVLLSMEQATFRVLASMGEVLVSSPSERRCRVLRALKMMISCKEDDLANWQESCSLKWCSLVQPSFFALLMSIVRQPFSDLRVAGLEVMVEVARCEWGQRKMQGCPGFLEYLLDREVVLEKEGRELKYEVVCICVESGCGLGVWGNVDMLKLRKYQREGPFHCNFKTSIAIEDSS